MTNTDPYGAVPKPEQTTFGYDGFQEVPAQVAPKYGEYEEPPAYVYPVNPVPVPQPSPYAQQPYPVASPYGAYPGQAAKKVSRASLIYFLGSILLFVVNPFIAPLVLQLLEATTSDSTLFAGLAIGSWALILVISLALFIVGLVIRPKAKRRNEGQALWITGIVIYGVIAFGQLAVAGLLVLLFAAVVGQV